jgi:hypothetical protein
MDRDDGEFLRAFEDATLPADRFHHRDHVWVAWRYLSDRPLLEALTRFTESLKRFAAAHGATGLYHETITWAYFFLIHERMATGSEGEGWEGFAARNPDLFTWKPSVLDSYYRPDTLTSDRARRFFLMPDL